MGYKELHDHVKTMNDELNVVKTEISEIKADISAIKSQVTNHLPSVLEEIKASLNILDDRIKPIETRLAKSTGVSEFLNLILKGTTAFAAITWTAIQIFKVFYHG